MDTTNRFAPPGAQVEDVALESAGFQAIRLWPPRGRIGSLRPLACNVGLYVFLIVVTLVLGSVAGATRTSPILGTVLAVLGIFAAVALPAHQTHAMRAKAGVAP